LVEALLVSFLEKGGQIFQGNTTAVSELIDAKAHPENYANLIVRVGGYSARFVNLNASLHDEIISRYRHSK
jgi:formate C-acetyltransferase